MPAEAGVVFRLGKGDGGLMTPQDFELSGADKKCAVPRLSVWVEGMTTTQQALAFAGPTASRYTTAGFCPVPAIRSLVPDPPTPEVKLDVVWEPARRRDGTFEDGPGAAGHAGVERLERGQPLQRKSFRAALARMANQHRVESLHAPPAPADDDP